MSTLALQLDEVLSQLGAHERAELETVVTQAIQRLTRQRASAAHDAGKLADNFQSSVLPLAAETPEENYYRRLRACAGSIPGFPEDFEESPWETDRDVMP